MAIGKVTLNEIVYKLKEFQNPLMLEILKNISMGYDDVISGRLSEPIFSPVRPHFRKGDEEGRPCRGRKMRKKGYRSKARQISTVFGKLILPLRRGECCNCGAIYSPLLSALQLGRYAHKESNFEHEAIKAVIDTAMKRALVNKKMTLT